MWQHHARGSVEAQIRDFEVDENVIGAVLPKHSIVDAGSVVDDDFRDAYFGYCSFKGSGQGDVVGDVGWIGMDGCRRGGGGDEGCITGKIVGRAGEEGDVMEAVRGEDASNVRANHGPGADNEDGTLRCHGQGIKDM